MGGEQPLAAESRGRLWQVGAALLLALLASTVGMYCTATNVLRSRGGGAFPFTFAAVLSADYGVSDREDGRPWMVSIVLDPAGNEPLISLYDVDAEAFAPLSPAIVEDTARDGAGRRTDAESLPALVGVDPAALEPPPGPPTVSPPAASLPDPGNSPPAASEGLTLGEAVAIPIAATATPRPATSADAPTLGAPGPIAPAATPTRSAAASSNPANSAPTPGADLFLSPPPPASPTDQPAVAAPTEQPVLAPTSMPTLPPAVTAPPTPTWGLPLVLPPTPTSMPDPTQTRVPTDTPAPTRTPRPTSEPDPTETPRPTATLAATSTSPSPTVASTAAPVLTATPSPTDTALPTATPLPASPTTAIPPTASPTTTTSPTATPTASPPAATPTTPPPAATATPQGNRPPVANDLRVQTSPGRTARVTLTGSDPDGDPITFTVLTSPARGSLSGTVPNLFYTSVLGAQGSDSFTYQVSDGRLDSAPATVRITINQSNNAPTALADRYGTAEDRPLLVAAPGVLGNDSDPDGDVLSAVLVSGPTRGRLTLNADGSFSYAPDPNVDGADSFTYQATDNVLTSSPATVTLNISTVNDPPVADSQTLTTAEDTPLSIVLTGSDPNGDPITFRIVSGPAYGMLDGLTYTPSPDFSGSDSFTIVASDGRLDSAPATISIAVTPVNDPPTATDDAYSTAEDATLAIGTAQGVLANDVDADGGPLGATLVSGPSKGSLTLNTDGSFRYVPAANSSGADSFTYRADDGRASSPAATVRITISRVNDPPVAADDGYSTSEDTRLDVPAATGVLANDADPDADPLSPSLVRGPANGTLTLNADGSFSYAPNANFNGTDRFTYQLSDGSLTSNLATVSIVVAAVNDAPVADPQSVSAGTLLARPITLTGWDVDGNLLSYRVVRGPSNGSLSGTPPNVSYTSNALYIGPDSFSFVVNDGALDSAPATVSITVSLLGGGAPTASDQSVTTAEDTPVAITLSASGGGGSLRYRIVRGPSRGSLSGTPPNVTYTPNVNDNGADSFTFRANDGTSDSNLATVSLSVTAVDDPPVANADGYTVAEDGTLTVAAVSGVLVNDTDVEGDALSAVLVSGPTRGSLTLNADGSFRYTPATDFNGTDRFTYRAADGATSSNVATVTITVSPVNDPPAAANDRYSTLQSTSLAISAGGILANDVDVDGDTLTAVRVAGPRNGTLSLNGDGSFVYTPAPSFTGSDSFTYQASDGSAASSIATVSITVNPDPPRVVGSYPADQQAAVDRADSVQITFSRGMDQLSVYDAGNLAGSAFCLYPAASSCAAGRLAGSAVWSSDGRTFIFNPSATLAGTTYYRAVVTTFARDRSGVQTAATYAISFQTAGGTDTAQPKVQAHWPADGTSGLAVTTTIQVDFTESMDRAATQAGFCVSSAVNCGGTPIGGTFTWSADSTSLSFAPAATLRSNATYYVQVCGDADACTTRASDLAGNALKTEATKSAFQFATGDSAPLARMTAPSAGAFVRGTAVPISGTASWTGSGSYSLNLSSRADSCGSAVKDSADRALGTNTAVVAGTLSRRADGTVSAWDTTRSPDGPQYLCLDVNTSGSIYDRVLVTVDNTAPRVGVQSPKDAKNAFVRQPGQQVTVAFTYTELNPQSYTVRVCADGSTEAACAATNIGEVLFAGSLSGQANASIAQTMTLSGTAANGTYDVRVSMLDRAGNVGFASVAGGVIIQGSAGVIQSVSASPNPFASYAPQSTTVSVTTSTAAKGLTVEVESAPTASSGCLKPPTGGVTTWSWDGKDGNGAFVLNGAYQLVVTAYSDGSCAAGNDLDVASTTVSVGNAGAPDRSGRASGSPATPTVARTATATPTVTPTAVTSPTPTSPPPVASLTATSTRTAAPTATGTPTVGPTATAGASRTPTPPPSATVTPSPTRTPVPLLPTATPAQTPTAGAAQTATAGVTPTPTAGATVTPTASATATRTPPATPSGTPSPTSLPTSVAVAGSTPAGSTAVQGPVDRSPRRIMQA